MNRLLNTGSFLNNGDFDEVSFDAGSISFSGTQNLSPPSNNALQQLTDPFTVEAWIYPTVVGTVQNSLWSTRTPDVQNAGWDMFINVNGKLVWGTRNQVYILGTTTLTVNTWAHAALVRSSTTSATLYLNGVSEGTITVSATQNFTNNTLTVGGGYTGLMTGFRLVKGVAMYSGPFTPPQSILPAVPGTSLLLNVINSANFITDGGLYNFTLTNTGPATWSATGYYNRSQAASGTTSFRQVASDNSYMAATELDETTLNVGSMEFNAANSKITISNTGTALQFGTGDYTIEAWIRPESFTGPKMIFANWGGPVANGYTFFCANNTGVLSAQLYVDNLNGNAAPALNAWSHVAVTRQSSTWRAFVNGALVANTTSTQSGNGSGTPCVGNTTDVGAANWFDGQISNLRVVKGTAMYTAPFTPPKGILPNVSGTGLLLNVPNQPNAIKDNSSNGFALTTTGNGVVQWNGSNPWGNKSGSTYCGSLYGNSNTYFYTPSSTLFALGTGDFTIECWCLAAGSDYVSGALIDFRQSGAGSNQVKPLLYFHNQFESPADVLSYIVNGVSVISFALGETIRGQWYHVAAVRNNGVTKVYLNGVANSTSYTDANDYGSVAQDVVFQQVGDSRSGNGNTFNGWVTNIRIVKGNAVYTSDFIPSNEPLTVVPGTSLLALMATSATAFSDSSPNNLTMLSGGASWDGNVTPFYGVPALRQTSTGILQPNEMDEVSLNTGSIAFNTNSYLDPGSNAAFAMGTGNFTLQAWIYVYKLGTTMAILDTRNPDTANAGWDLYINASSQVCFGTNGANYMVGSTTIAANTWYNVIVIRDSVTTMKLYLNGSQDASTSSVSATQNFTNTALLIADGANGNFNGLISGISITKGTAVSSTPSQSVQQPTAATSLLLNVINSSTFSQDSSSNSLSISNPATTLATWCNSGPFNQGYGGGAMNFTQGGDGSTVQYVISPASSTTNLGSSNFTAECWFLAYPGQYDSLNNIFGFRSATYQFGPFFFGLENAGSVTTAQLSLYSSSDGSSWNLANATNLGVINVGTWNHVALVRSGNSMQAYVNGVATGSAINMTSVTFSQTSAPFTIGGVDFLSNDQFAGLITNVRLVVGTAVYNSNFIVPTSPLTAMTNTKLLLLASNNATVTTDSSTNNFAMTNTGSVTWTYLGPFNGQ